MSAHQLSSGEPHSAAELMEQALERTPGWAAGWFQLGEYEEKAGRGARAANAFEKVLALDPEDMFGAGLKLALLGAADMPQQPPSRYVEQLFDDYADRFDTALVKKLRYSVPEKLAELVLDRRSTGHRFAHATDLGCGTGLFGIRIRASVSFLEGFDLSANMLARAAEKAVYDLLQQADLSLAPEASGIFSQTLAAARADLVSAADVLMYLGNLESVFAIVSRLLRPGGLFAFSVEDAATGEGFRLLPSLRFAHSEAYVRNLCNVHGLSLAEPRRTIIRMDGGEPVHGILFLAEMPA